ncbi:hypothetical protein [Lacticaseibacillus paracasei]|uniref:hypothetical protein n=1 Tax=Lacticaseibacillus paracasei TaxID=1597 RepID=UPI001C484D42|nr:hypothetical protein [Lacticaseibacillus paracasei]QXJ67488.1 hypothetical protein J5Y16_11350 [Lacticaseibacillus paracasei subsp. paracasei]
MNIREAIIAAGEGGGFKTESSPVFIPTNNGEKCTMMFNPDNGKFESNYWNPNLRDLICDKYMPVKKEALLKDFHIKS